ncbi:TVP38/TMEM64 family protein, partial [bacterium]
FRKGRDRAALGKFILFFAFFILAALAARAMGVSQYLEGERLRSLIEGFGPLAPAAYMLLFIIGPSLSLPGLPITIAGGILFGPFWGVVYTITSATIGACLAFLAARYLARDFVEKRLSGTKLGRLDEEVAKNGWKVVAVTRLVPLFPFNLLNFALGLTKIGFWPYAITTFFCMLPATVAYVVFSSSLLDLLRGEISPVFLFGALLVVFVSILPVILKRFSKDGPKR